MLLNTVNEMAYVGLTTGRMRDRLKQHVRHTRGDPRYNRLYDDMRSYPPECWEAIILQRCESLDELLEAERSWIQALSVADPNVGYNDGVPDEAYAERFKKQNPGPHVADSKELGWFTLDGVTDFLTDEHGRTLGRAMGKTGAAHGAKGASCGVTNGGGKRKADMTPEELEFFRAAGRKSVEAKGLDFYRECGKKGGAAKHEKPADSEEMRRRVALGQARKLKNV